MVNLAAYIRFAAFEWYTPASFWKAFRFGQMSSSTSALAPSNISSGINIREQQDAFDLYVIINNLLNLVLRLPYNTNFKNTLKCDLNKIDTSIIMYTVGA